MPLGDLFNSLGDIAEGGIADALGSVTEGLGIADAVDQISGIAEGVDPSALGDQVAGLAEGFDVAGIAEEAAAGAVDGVVGEAAGAVEGVSEQAAGIADVVDQVSNLAEGGLGGFLGGLFGR